MDYVHLIHCLELVCWFIVWSGFVDSLFGVGLLIHCLEWVCWFIV